MSQLTLSHLVMAVDPQLIVIRGTKSGGSRPMVRSFKQSQIYKYKYFLFSTYIQYNTQVGLGKQT